MITLYGPAAFANFELDKLQADLGSGRLSARLVHFVDGNLDDEDKVALEHLLDYGEKADETTYDNYVIIVPRIGTISPWSSKATDIAKNAGLESVNRIERGVIYYTENVVPDDKLSGLYDRMTEQMLDKLDKASQIFAKQKPRPLVSVPMLEQGRKALEQINYELGLAISDEEIDYLLDRFSKLKRNPTDVELMMFGVANSEHCRHKIFNAQWSLDDEIQDKSLFAMIKNTHQQNSDGVLSAYHDNGAVLEGFEVNRFFANPETNEYESHAEQTDIVIKAETHNHPTAIAPFPGSGTGSGGEIRDEGSTGLGAKPKAGLTGFSVSNLQIPGFEQPWEKVYGKPSRIVSPLEIMTEGPLGAAAFNNEFGRTGLAGYFRTFEYEFNGKVRGYHKPIMLGGGLAAVRHKDVDKKRIPHKAKLIVLGGPAMLIGLGGGAASSQKTGQQSEDLDYASVQRQNPEMQRRAQEVINACWASEPNPILSIHDVGAGGWSNALPEIIKDAGRGGKINLADLPNADSSLSPMELWSNESQERYVLAIMESDVDKFTQICKRERCIFAVVGEATTEQNLIVRYGDDKPVDVPMDLIFGSSPKLHKKANKPDEIKDELDLTGVELEEALHRVLRLPAVASKSFLITIGDRTVGGLNVRDQMVGPWQVPVADVAVTAADFDSKYGEALAMGERTPLALISGPASARMAIGELITNMAAARIGKISDIKLSANWMAASGLNDEDWNLYQTVRAVGEEFCPALGLTIPVGKDSLSMKTQWQENGQEKSVTAPLSLIISGFAPVQDTYKSMTPQLQSIENTSLVLVDLSDGNSRLGGSALVQVYSQFGSDVPDVDNPEIVLEFFRSIQKLNQEDKILAYHDRSDGGLITTVLEMCFAGRMGAKLDIDSNLENLFNEELGAVIQIRDSDLDEIMKNLPGAQVIGTPATEMKLSLRDDEFSVTELLRIWSETSYKIQRLRDNPATADSEFEALADDSNKGLNSKLSFEIPHTFSHGKTRPKVAILREQGVNGQIEIAAAFSKVGFTAVDVHMTDLIEGRQKLSSFVGLAAGGGFSYGDVLGAGGGWAKSILFNQNLHAQFREFFEREDSFSIGICNGCQMLSHLKSIIPGANDWPEFKQNISRRFEARLVMAEIIESPSIMLKDMAGSRIPVPTAHGEGFASFISDTNPLSAMRYIDNDGNPTEQYPFNPNGSKDGLTGFTTEDGRVTIMMPHPERAFLSKQFSWAPSDWGVNSPWIQMFDNARKFVN